MSNKEELINGAIYDFVNGVTYDLINGVTYDEDIEQDVIIEEEKITAANLSQSVTLESVNPFLEVIRSKKQFEQLATNVDLDCSVERMVGISDLNYELKLNRRIVTVTDLQDGESAEYLYEILVTVHLQNGTMRQYPAVVASSKVRSTEWLQRATHSLARIPKGKEEQEMYQAMIQRCLEEDDVPCEYIYPTPGWRNVSNERTMRFVHYEGTVGEDNPLIHTAKKTGKLNYIKNDLGKKETFLSAISAMDICKDGKASTSLLIFSHAALLATLFEMADIPIKFVYGIVGVTNSRKTSLALALSKIYDRNTMTADAEFATATACGIEKTLSLYKDGVVIIDDFKPAVNYAQQKEMDKKLDELVRYYGNRVSKVRMTEFSRGNQNLHFPIQGGCVITMEHVTGVLSSLSRMYIAEISVTDVDNVKLSYFQTNKYLMPTHYYDFLSWVTDNFDEVLNKIECFHNGYRRNYKFEVPRFNENIAVLMATAHVIADYAMARLFWNEVEAKLFLQKVEGVLVVETIAMQERFNSRDKASLVVEAITDSILKQKIVPVRLTKESCAEQYDVYEDENYIFVKAQYLRRVVNAYARENGDSIVILSEDELLDLMERVGLLDIEKKEARRERSRKLPTQKGNSRRYMYINKSKMYEFINK